MSALKKHNQYLYDYDRVIKSLERKGKQKFGDGFSFQPNDILLVKSLAAYFLQDDVLCRQNEIDLDKGILLSGPIGCGKTSLMQLMQLIPNQQKKFRFKSCRQISFEFIEDGYQVIHKYTRGDIYKTNTYAYCFDDLGTESNIKYYGNECNVMAEILLSRYDLHTSQGLLTHVTTNLSTIEIEEIYGNRLRSRLRQMVNLISFDKTCTDKRK